jgi:two-component system, OmpR family, KDP operon response regulator KdpE
MEIKPAILIIDDEIQIRKILRITLESKGFKVVEAESGSNGIVQAASYHPELIILDLGLPDQDGISVLKEIRSWSSVPVIILSVRNSEDDIITALEIGADDYMTKPFNTGELLARIRASLRRNSQVQESSIFVNGSLKIDLLSHTVTKDDEEIKLTLTEYQLLVLFAKNIGKVLTHGLILKEIWGSAYSEQTQYLRVFIGQLRKKIESDPAAPKLIKTESGVGYRMLYQK